MIQARADPHGLDDRTGRTHDLFAGLVSASPVPTLPVLGVSSSQALASVSKTEGSKNGNQRTEDQAKKKQACSTERYAGAVQTIIAAMVSSVEQVPQHPRGARRHESRGKRLGRRDGVQLRGGP